MAAGYHDFTAGEVLTAANLEDYCQNQGIMRFADAATRDTALASVKTEGMFAYLIDTNTLTVYTGSAWSTIGPVHGALTSWTPAITQSGSVTVTNNGSTYTRTGRWIQGQFSVAVTGSGTGANDVTISLPVTAAYPGSFPMTVGRAELTDTSATDSMTGILQLASATTMKIRFSTNGARTYLGSAGLTDALANNDTIGGTFQYEAAADA